jgi:tetratricopeptide (TPR) repeat protein
MARYGRSQAQELLSRGEADEALEAADADIASRGEGQGAASAWLDRGAALDMLERYADAADAFSRAFELDVAGDLDRLELDDGYFAATLAAARDEATRGDVAKGTSRLDTYVTRFPLGNHVAEAKTWKARMRGEMPSLLDKTRDANDVDLP